MSKVRSWKEQQSSKRSSRGAPTSGAKATYSGIGEEEWQNGVVLSRYLYLNLYRGHQKERGEVRKEKN